MRVVQILLGICYGGVGVVVARMAAKRMLWSLRRAAYPIDLLDQAMVGCLGLLCGAVWPIATAGVLLAVAAKGGSEA